MIRNKGDNLNVMVYILCLYCSNYLLQEEVIILMLSYIKIRQLRTVLSTYLCRLV